jgi:hypothetical protein
MDGNQDQVEIQNQNQELMNANQQLMAQLNELKVEIEQQIKENEIKTQHEKESNYNTQPYILDINNLKTKLDQKN